METSAAVRLADQENFHALAKMSAQRSLLMRYQSRRPCYCYLYSKEVEILNLETRQKLFWASGSDLAYIGYFTLSHRYLVIVSIET